MWTLVLVLSFTTYGNREYSSAAALDHVDGFQSQQQCIEASRHIARHYRKGHLKMYCIKKG